LSNLSFTKKTSGIKGKKAFGALIDKLYQKLCAVNIQKPFAHPEKVLEWINRSKALNPH